MFLGFVLELRGDPEWGNSFPGFDPVPGVFPGLFRDHFWCHLGIISGLFLVSSLTCFGDVSVFF